MSELATFIARMPKAELHVHLEGTLEPELKFELAARNGLDLPYDSVDEMRAAYAFNDLPSFLAVRYEGGTVIEGFRRAQQDAETSLELQTQLIMCFLRDLSAESAMETLNQSMPYGDWIVGVGLDSDERGNPPVKFKDVFARARREGYRLTMHCDVDQEDSVGHIWQCLDEICRAGSGELDA